MAEEGILRRLSEADQRLEQAVLRIEDQEHRITSIAANGYSTAAAKKMCENLRNSARLVGEIRDVFERLAAQQ